VLCEVAWRAREHQSPQIDKPRSEFGIGETGIHFPVELFDELCRELPPARDLLQQARMKVSLDRARLIYCCGIPAASRTAFPARELARHVLAEGLGGRAAQRPRGRGQALLHASSARLSLIALLSLAMIAPGVSRGANTPYHVVTS